MRLFVEAVIDEAALDSVWAVGERLRAERSAPDRVLRWIRRPACHLTLRFLGEQPTERVAELSAALGAARSAGPIALTLDHFGAFGGRRPRVIWAGCREDDDHKRLLALRASLDDALAHCGIAPERASYRPHLTLARVRRHATDDDRSALRRVLDSPPPLEVSATVDALALVESRLSTDGPQYHRLAMREL